MCIYKQNINIPTSVIENSVFTNIRVRPVETRHQTRTMRYNSRLKLRTRALAVGNTPRAIVKNQKYNDMLVLFYDCLHVSRLRVVILGTAYYTTHVYDTTKRNRVA